MNLEEPGQRTALAAKLLNDIDDYCVRTMSDGHRHHLGASLIGEECSRKLWYMFRWVHAEKFTGQQMRLFNRGHLEEARFTSWLRGIGCEIKEFQDDVTTQYRISAVDGHFGGSLDGMLELPATYANLPIFLAEFKTSNDKNYKKMVKAQSVALDKPQHFAQMSTYGAAYDFDYAVYMMINKNDDHIYIEIVKLDRMLGAECVKKAEDIIKSQFPPQKISQDATFFKCKSFCAFTSICHYGAPIEKNCRSCVNAHPIQDAQWFCDHFGTTIPKDYLIKGCDNHTPIVGIPC